MLLSSLDFSAHDIEKDFKNDDQVNETMLFLKETNELFKDIKIGYNRLPSVIGAIMATEAITQLFDYYRSLSIDHFFSGWFTQDAIENIFSVVRARKNLPSGKEFAEQLKIQSITRFCETNVSGSFYERDDSFENTRISF